MQEYPKAVYPNGKDQEFVIVHDRDHEDKVMGVKAKPVQAAGGKKKQMFSLEE